jgi:hypothetical protein
VSDSIGEVLIDNTTIFGASAAYESWPPAADEWLKGTHALNLRSLMDILEAIVLHDRLAVDSSSRMIRSEDGAIVPDSPWPELSQLKDRHGFGVVAEAPYSVEENEEFIFPVIQAAFAALETYLNDKTFARELSKFQRYDTDVVLPKIIGLRQSFVSYLSAVFMLDLMRKS